MLLKSPGFSIVAILTLALGIGANTAIFSVVESALLRPLPFPGADRLVRLYETFDETSGRRDLLNLSQRTAEQWREYGKDIFEGIATATGGAATAGATATTPARIVPAARISANFLTVLGLSPVLGRNFTPAEDQPGGARVAIIGHDFWQRNFGARPDVLGQTVNLDDRLYTIIGVMPKTFRHPYRAEVWLPLAPNGRRYRPATIIFTVLHDFALEFRLSRRMGCAAHVQLETSDAGRRLMEQRGVFSAVSL